MERLTTLWKASRKLDRAIVLTIDACRDAGVDNGGVLHKLQDMHHSVTVKKDAELTEIVMDAAGNPDTLLSVLRNVKHMI